MRSLIPIVLLATLAVPAAAEAPFDLHVHIWNGEASVRDYESQLRSTGMTVSGFGAIHMAVLGKVAETRLKNDELIALSKKYPKLLPIPSVHPYDGAAAIAELERLAGLGIRIIKLHPHTQKFDAADPRARALCKRAGELGIIILMDNANIIPGDSETLFNLALETPKTTFLFAHMGGWNFRFWNILLAARTAKGLFAENIYFDVSGILPAIAGSPIAAEYVWTLRNVGTDHVLIGADYPQYSLKQSVDALEALALTRAEKDRILYGNARRLLFGKRTTDGRR